MQRILYRLIAMLARLAVRSRRTNELEIIVLRHQLVVLRRQIDRPAVNNNDRTLLGAIAAALPANDEPAGSSDLTPSSDGTEDGSPNTGHNPVEDQHARQPRTRSTDSSSASPPRTQPGATDASTASWPTSAIGSLHRPYGRSSKPAASNQRPSEPRSPGPSSSTRKPP